MTQLDFDRAVNSEHALLNNTNSGKWLERETTNNGKRRKTTEHDEI